MNDQAIRSSRILSSRKEASIQVLLHTLKLTIRIWTGGGGMDNLSAERVLDEYSTELVLDGLGGSEVV